MSALLLMIALIIFGFSAWGWASAAEQVRRILPPNLQDDLTLRFAIDKFIWERSVPANARRKYIASSLLAGIAMLLIGAAVYKGGAQFGAYGFFGISLLIMVLIIRSLIKYRRLL